MAKDKKKDRKTHAHAYYTAEGQTLRRSRPFCPKCGPGTKLAKHKDRSSCGRCGFTEFPKGKDKGG